MALSDAKALERPPAPTLRLLPRGRRVPSELHCARPAEPIDRRPALRGARERSRDDFHRVLVAGKDPVQRTAVLQGLSSTMPSSTVFEEASAFSQVLVRAPGSRMVVLSGELDDTPAESLMAKLAHRHPGLPVVSLQAAPPARF